MVTPARVRTEIRRELLRPSSLWMLPAVLGACLPLGLFALSKDVLELYTPAIYLLIPMLAVPLAAHRAARDRERDLAAVQGTTPLTLAEVLVAKFAALSLLLALVLLATAPMLLVMVHPTATGALLQASPLFAWGLVVGLVSVVVGLGVGFSLGRGGALALSVGFAVLVAWFLVAVLRQQILAWAASERGSEVLQALVHTSPLTWGLEALAPEAPYLLPGHAGHLAALMLLLAALLAALGALVIGLQHMGGWRPWSTARPVTGAVLAASLLAGGAVLAAAGPVEPTSEPHPPVAEAVAGDVHVRGGVAIEGDWSKHTPGTLHLTFTGHPNATVSLDAVALQAESASVAQPPVAPGDVVLDHVIPAPDHAPPGVGDRAGTAHVPVPLVLTVHRMDVEPVLTVTLVVDGQPVTLVTQQSASHWEMPVGASMLTGGVTLAVAATFAIVVPRRLNTW